MTLSKVHFAYDTLKVYRGIDLEIEKGQRTVLVGPNGAGKSTLLKILGGVLQIQQGERKEGLNAEVGYYSQNRVDMLNANRTVLQEVMSIPNPVPERPRAPFSARSFSRATMPSRKSACCPAAKNRASAWSSCCSIRRICCSWTSRRPTWTWPASTR